jgi:hypothetical protein
VTGRTVRVGVAVVVAGVVGSAVGRPVAQAATDPGPGSGNVRFTVTGSAPGGAGVAGVSASSGPDLPTGSARSGGRAAATGAAVAEWVGLGSILVLAGAAAALAGRRPARHR